MYAAESFSKEYILLFVSGPPPEQLDDSVFAQRKKWSDAHDFYDPPELLRRMFNLDWERCVHGGLMKDEANASAAEFELDDEDLLEVRLALSNNRKNLYEAFAHYCTMGAGDHAMAAYEKASEHSSINTALIEQSGNDHARMTHSAFVSFVRDCDIGNDTSCSPDVIDSTFEWVTRDDTPPATWAKMMASIDPVTSAQEIAEQVGRGPGGGLAGGGVRGMCTGIDVVGDSAGSTVSDGCPPDMAHMESFFCI